ncbi:Peroxisome assembly protein 12 [Yarrowia sp. C11]|nr:Peroxisome assembly protein 12 [Yarrowia sp. C11]KAG5359424.1 Peroxisome assembly protein 12 [Yarrowia sp. E02]
MDYFSSLNASQLDPDVPTLFELLSAKQLEGLIAPSVRYILAFYAQRHPRYLLRIVNRYDELYALLMGLVEYYNLKTWNASFTEKFYGLKRTQILTNPALRTRQAVPDLVEAEKRLSKKKIWGSLFFLIVVPYVKEKLDARYERLKGRYLARDINEERAEIKRTGTAQQIAVFEFDYWLLKLYPIVTMGCTTATLAFHMLFLFSVTRAYSIDDFLLNIQFSRMTRYDYQMEAQRDSRNAANVAHTMKSISEYPIAERVMLLLTTKAGANALRSAALNGLSYVLPTSIFALKFLEWWYASDFARQLNQKRRGDLEDNLPVPDKVKGADKLAESVAKWKEDTSKCPLCSKELVNPTVIESGYVFCYTCIYRHLEDGEEETGGRCPVTGQKLLGCRWQDDMWQVTGLRRLMV